MRRPRILLALLAAITGCSREPSFRDVQRDRVPLAPVERAAIERLLDGAGVAARELALAGDGPGVATIEGGHVIELRFGWRLDDPAPLSYLGALRKLHLGAARFTDLRDFGAHPALVELGLGGFRGRVASLEGLSGCGELRQLSVRGPLATLAPLAVCPGLEELYLDGPAIADLATLPPLPRLRLLSLGQAKLTSLAGLERAEGLERLVLVGARELRRLEGLPPLPRLRRLEIHGGGLTSLTGLPVLPALEAMEIERTPLAALEDLPPLPSLRHLELESNAIERLALQPLPELTELDLSGNAIVDLTGLGEQPRLASLTLTGNPIEDLEPLLGLPGLSWLDVHDTEVTAVPRELAERRVAVRVNESRLEANYWEKGLREAWSDENFVERLPGGTGRLERHRGDCRWSAATFREARLTCEKRADSLTGFLHVGLIGVDPLSPTAGGPNVVRVRVTLSVTEGVARVYVRDRIDFKGLAEALAGHTDRSRPLISFGDRRDPEDYRDGYRFAEARPGEPATVSGEAFILVDQVVIWLEAPEGTARGVEYTVQPP